MDSSYFHPLEPHLPSKDRLDSYDVCSTLDCADTIPLISFYAPSSQTQISLISLFHHHLEVQQY